MNFVSPQCGNGAPAATGHMPFRSVAIGGGWAHGGVVNAASSLSPPRLTVWYDGDCPLCLREIALMRRLDLARRIEFVDLIGDQACPLDRRVMLERLHAREGGRLLSGAAAFAAMWRAIPLLRPLGELARVPLVLRGLEAAYVRFLRVRPALQRLMR